MYVDHYSATAIFHLSDLDKASKLASSLRRWVSAIETNNRKMPVIDIAGANPYFYQAIDDIYSKVVEDVEGFIAVVGELSINEFDSELRYISNDINIDMASEVLRLFLLLEDEVNEWRIVYVKNKDTVLDPNDAGLIIITKEHVESADIESLYDSFVEVASKDDRSEDDLY